MVTVPLFSATYRYSPAPVSVRVQVSVPRNVTVSLTDVKSPGALADRERERSSTSKTRLDSGASSVSVIAVSVHVTVLSPGLAALPSVTVVGATESTTPPSRSDVRVEPLVTAKSENEASALPPASSSASVPASVGVVGELDGLALEYRARNAADGEHVARARRDGDVAEGACGAVDGEGEGILRRRWEGGAVEGPALRWNVRLIAFPSAFTCALSSVGAVWSTLLVVPVAVPDGSPVPSALTALTRYRWVTPSASPVWE